MRRLMQDFAAQALASFGEPARPHLLEGLKQGDQYIRSAIMEAIGKQQPDFQEAIPLMLDALRSEDRGVRDDAGRALARMQPTREEWLPQLERALDEGAPGVPVALARYGSVIAPRLLERIRDPDHPGAEGAVTAFALLQPPPGEDVVGQLIDLLGSENEQVLHRARRALEGGWAFTQPHMIEALNNHSEP